MELFSVTLMSPSDEKLSCLTRCLSDAFADLHMSAEEHGMWEVEQSTGRLRLIGSGNPAAERELRQSVIRRAAEGMAEYVLTETEPMLLKMIARKQHHYEADEDLESIVWHCRQLLDGAAEEPPGTSEARARRKGRIAGELATFLTGEAAARIHLDGYVTFRLASYWEELRDIVEYAVDEFVMDKQYQEFISLLKYFVCLQETKMPVIHLMHVADSEFELFDERHEPIEAESVDRIAAEMLETEMNVEDMVVSNLISLSPQQIVIHTRRPELPVVRTIEAIFDGRVTVCTRCRSCGVYFGKDHRIT